MAAKPSYTAAKPLKATKSVFTVPSASKTMPSKVEMKAKTAALDRLAKEKMR